MVNNPIKTLDEERYGDFQIARQEWELDWG